MELAGPSSNFLRFSRAITCLIALIVFPNIVTTASAQDAAMGYDMSSAQATPVQATPAERAASLKYAKKAALTTCTEGQLPNGDGGDVEITTGTCHVKAGVYKYRNVNIYKGGELL